MKVGALELQAVRLPLRRPFVTAAGALEVREGFLVFASGGVGEAMPLPTSGTEPLEACRAALEAFEGGEVRSVEEVEALVRGVPVPCARFAVETALLDALARERGVPVARLLDAAPRTAVAVNAVVDKGAGELPQGFSSFKVKVAGEADLARARWVREQAGPLAELRLDANGAWSLETATRLLRALEELRPSYCEDPLALPDERLGALTRVPIAADAWLADERLRRRVVAERLADVLVLKPAVLGGVLRARALAFEARARGLTVVVTSTLEGVVGRLAALHLAAALPSQHPAGLATGALLAEDHFDDPAPVRDALMFVPSGPGLGLRGSAGVRGAGPRRANEPATEALVCGGERWSWQQLQAQVAGQAAQLAAAGVAPGDSVALPGASSVGLVVHLLALARLGARAVGLSPRLTAFEREAQLQRLSPRRVLTELTLAPPAERAWAAHPSAGAVLFTSGTTGVAKAAFLRHAAFEAAARASRARLGTGAGTRWLCSLPLYHVGGLALLWRWVHERSTLVLHDGFDEAAVLDALAGERITHASFVAATLQRVLERARGPFPHLKVALVGGGPTPQRLVDEARREGLPVRLTYGLTEACAQVTTQLSAEGYDCGPPLDGVQVRIGPSEEIEVKSPGLFTCYLFDERATAEARGGGWLRTGDYGHLDAQGRLTVLGRRTDLLVSGGENVYPAEIEAALLQHPTVRDAGVVPMADARWGQVPLALVVQSHGELDEAALREWCRDRLASFKVPARFRRVPALPRNALGKLDRRALATLFEGGNR